MCLVKASCGVRLREPREGDQFARSNEHLFHHGMRNPIGRGQFRGGQPHKNKKPLGRAITLVRGVSELTVL